MEQKFVNKFTRSFEIEKELYRYLHLTSRPITICYILLGIVLVVNLAMIIANGLAYANMSIFAMCVIVLFVLFFRYYSSVTTAKKRFAEETNNKGEITITATLTDDELLSESSDREKAIIVPYSKIAKVFLTENFYMIQTTDQMIYAFKKGAFIAGKEESFLPFVNEIISKNNRKHK